MISRETRRLLVTIAVSVAALWVLARIRFQERPSPQTPVAPVLAQLRPAAGYDDLARAVADVRPVVAAAIVPTVTGSAFRVGAERAIALDPDEGMPVVARDRATGLAVIHVAAAQPAGVMPWMPRVLDYPRFLLVADRTHDTVVVRPVFVGTLTSVDSPYWQGEVWQLPAGDFPTGCFLFTIEGALAGVIVDERGRRAIVPAARLLEAANRLAASPPRPQGVLGVDVQPVSPALAAVLGVESGVIVSAVDAAGPAANDLAPTDVIEAIDDHAIDTVDQWRARVLRLAAGDAVSLRVRSARESRIVQMTAAPLTPPATQPANPTLGLQLVPVANSGSRVVQVEPGSRGADASLQPGDVITAVGRQTAPTPPQIVRAFAAVPPGGALIIAFTRGQDHRLAPIRKTTSEAQ